MGADRVAGLLGLLAGVAFVGEAIRLGAGTLRHPEAGLFPLLGGVTLGALSTLVLVRGRRGQPDAPRPLRLTRRQGLLIAGMAVYAATLEPLGDLLATAALAALCLHAFGLRSWLVIAGSSATIAALLHVVLVRALGMDLPAGLLAHIE